MLCRVSYQPFEAGRGAQTFLEYGSTVHLEEGLVPVLVFLAVAHDVEVELLSFMKLQGLWLMWFEAEL